MMSRQIVAGLQDGDEIDWRNSGALMQQLKKSMLTVGAHIAPDDRTSRRLQRAAVEADTLAVAFHFKLLEISRKMAQIMMVGRNRYRTGAEQIAMPDTHQPQHHRHILFQRRVAEMGIHGMCAGQELRKMIETDR